MSKLPAIKKAITSTTVNARFDEMNEMKLNFQREAGFALQHLGDNPYLAGADQQSIVKAVINVALTGLTLNPTLKQAYLVPRKVKGQLLCILEPSYQGLISLMIEAGQADDVYANMVFEGDDFEMNIATREIPVHKPFYLKKVESGEPIGCYAMALLPNGTRKFEFLPMDRIFSIRDRSESYKSAKKNNNNNSIWLGPDKEEMYKKTAIKALWKYMPKNNRSAMVAQAIETDNEANEIDLGGNSTRIDNAEGEEVKFETKEPATAAVKKAVEKVEEAQVVPEEKKEAPIQATEHTPEAPAVSETPAHPEEEVAEAEEEVVAQMEAVPDDEPEAEEEEIINVSENEWPDWIEGEEFLSEQDLMNKTIKGMNAAVSRRGLTPFIGHEGRNTNKKLRMIVLDHQVWAQANPERVVAAAGSTAPEMTQAEMTPKAGIAPTDDNEEVSSEQLDNMIMGEDRPAVEADPFAAKGETTEESDFNPIDYATTKVEEIGIVEGEERPAAQMSEIWHLMGDHDISEGRALEMFAEHEKLSAYKSKEVFAKTATKADIIFIISLAAQEVDA